jgi:hypothetical protein
MFIAGMSTVTSLTLLVVLTFMQSIIMGPLTNMVLAGTYTRTFGMTYIPIIQNMIWWILLLAAIVSVIWMVVEAFSEVSYYPDA